MNSDKTVNETPTVIMLVGPPASGKSTWVKNFMSTVENKSSWIVLGTDLIIDNYAAKHGITYTDAFNKLDRKSVESKFKTQLREAFNQNKNVIWDQTNTSLNARRKKIASIPKQYDIKAVAFEVNRDELNRRLGNRQKETGKHIPDSVVDTMISSYVRPSKAEGFSDVKVIS